MSSSSHRRHRSSTSNNTPQDSKGDGPCCTWPKIAVLVLLLVVGAVLIWKFAPIDDAINNILPTFNNTGMTGSGNNNNPSPSPPGSTMVPTTANPASTYDFMKCSLNASTTTTSAISTSCCNGLYSICDLRVDEILYASVHNAMASFEDGFLFGPNQRYKLEGALQAGYRGINLDVCNCAGEYVFCHGVCSFGTRTVEDTLTSINNFLDENPSEVIVMPLELNNDVDLPVDLFDFYNNYMLPLSSLISKIYVHSANGTEPWPTLGDLVESNQRLIVFHYRGPNCNSDQPCPDGLHWYYRFGADTQFDFASLNDIEDTSTSCTLERSKRDTATFFGVNNFVTPPDQSTSGTLNEYQFAKTRLETCSQINGNMNVNFIYADFWDEGDLPRLTQDHNMALARRRRRLRLS